MNIIIAEKPKVAYKIAHALSDLGKPKRIIDYGVPIYKINNYLIIPAAGHIFGIKAKTEAFTYPILDYEWKPAFECSKNAKYTKKFYYAFLKHANNANEIIVATDFDIEGSLIGYNIAKFIFNKEASRMKFSSLTPIELKNAYNNLIGFDYGNAIAGQTRHELDWLYGINLSRALMLAIRKAGLMNTLSIGRVQGPTLALVYDKEKEIKAFKPTPYWVVYAITNKGKFLHIKEQFWKKEEAEEVKNNTSKQGYIEELKEKEIKFYPPPAFDLSTLQQEAYYHLKFSPTKTLQIAQNLYESSYISYPRTSSQKLPPTIGYRNILKKLSKFYDTEFLLKKEKLYPTQGKKDDPAHPAIYPTGIIGKMSEEEKKLYDLIARRFIAAFCDPAIIKNINVILNANEKYKRTGKIIKQPGFFDVYYYAKPKEEIIDVKKDESIEIKQVKIQAKKTKPPKRYNEASLVKELEKRNLGTKTTRALIVKTLFMRRYLTSNKSIHITGLGMAVKEVFERYVPSIVSEELTRNIEAKLQRIQEGKLEKDDVINEVKEVIINASKEFKANEDKISKELAEKIKAYKAYKSKKAKH